MRTFEVYGKFGRDIRLDDVRKAAAEELRLRSGAVINVIDPSKSYQPQMTSPDAVCTIVKRSIDARGELKMVYTVEACRASEYKGEYKLPECQDVSGAPEVLVAGGGPAGMFAAIKLINLGLKPVVYERGRDVRARKVDIAAISRKGLLDGNSNFCYGEGGAGTFSDGKLYTRSSKRGDIREVLYRFVECGADRSILVDAHPHIGTDKLPKVVSAIRSLIEDNGGEYHFRTLLEKISRTDDGDIEVTSRNLETGETAVRSFKAVILATGHSAIDVYDMLSASGVTLEAKGFALGVRVEHPQSLINRIRYRGQWEEGMPAAEYSFAEQVPDENGVERGVFSFCMCPGGVIVPSSTEPESLVLNGMSNSARSSRWANAGVVVSIEPEDVPEEYLQYGPFSSLRYQQDIEKKLFSFVQASSAQNPFAAPAQRMADFCDGVVSSDLPQSSYGPGLVSAPLHELLPAGVAHRLAEAFRRLGQKGMRGYFTNDALLLGVESRTSSPVRIYRDRDTLQSPDMPGLFPCGEGAGYAGGIVSSAVDGINCAWAVSRYLKEGPSPARPSFEDLFDGDFGED